MHLNVPPNFVINYLHILLQGLWLQERDKCTSYPLVIMATQFQQVLGPQYHFQGLRLVVTNSFAIIAEYELVCSLSMDEHCWLSKEAQL